MATTKEGAKAPNPVHFHEGRWWFWDEVGQNRIGPFDTREQAKKGIGKYYREVLEGETERMETRTTATTKEILDEVGRARSEHRGTAHGQLNSARDWVLYIVEYATRASDRVRCHGTLDDYFRAMMVEVAAVAVAAIEAYDKGGIE